MRFFVDNGETAKKLFHLEEIQIGLVLVSVPVGIFWVDGATRATFLWLISYKKQQMDHLLFSSLLIFQLPSPLFLCTSTTTFIVAEKLRKLQQRSKSILGHGCSYAILEGSYFPVTYDFGDHKCHCRRQLPIFHIPAIVQIPGDQNLEELPKLLLIRCF